MTSGSVRHALTLTLVACCGSAGAGEITANRLLHAADESQNWLMHLGDYEGHRFSGLDQINRDTVGTLVPRFTLALGGLMDGAGNLAAALPISPLAENGFLYIVDGWGAVTKLDIAKQAIVWRSDAGQHNLDAWLQASRGLAFHGSSVLAIAADGKLHWIDSESGEITRSVQVGDPVEGYSISAPPLVVGDTIIVGGAGADRGARSQIDALDAVTGEHLWRTYPAPEGSVGGSFLQTGVYDQATNTTIWGASHAFPRFSEQGGVVAEYGNAVLALDVATGETRWTYEYPHGGEGEFSEAGSYQLIPREGSDQADLVHFGNDGQFYVFDATGPEPRIVTPYMADQADGAGCPNIRSTPAFASAYSPRTGLSYGAGADGCHPGVKPIITASLPGWLGAYYAGVDSDLGLLTAMDPGTGRLAAQRLFFFPLHAGALATAGGLVFTTTADGTVHALNDETLETVWSSKFATLAPLPPITFAAGGEQFIAIVVGGNAFEPELSYRPPESSMSQPLFVLVVLGQPA